MSAKEVFSKRVLAAMLWSSVVQVIIFTVYLVFVSLDILHPISWIVSVVSTLLHFKTYFHFIPIILATVALCLLYSRQYTVIQPCYTTRFNYLCSIFSVHNLLLCLVYIFLSVTVVWLYFKFPAGEWSEIARVCSESEKKCLVDSNFYIFLNSCYIGFVIFLWDYFFYTKQIDFPVVQQFKYLQFKAAITSLFYHAASSTLIPVLLFPMIYYYQFLWLRNYFCEFMNYSIGEDGIHKLQDVFSPFTIIYSWIFSTLFIVIKNVVFIILKVIVTEQIEFPIVQQNTGSLSSTTLQEGLSMKNVPILKHLACLDLLYIAKRDKFRREELFTLSQPGGHPRNWNGVMTECLKLLQEFSEDLSAASLEKVQADALTTQSNIYSFSDGPKVPNEFQTENTLNKSNLRNMTLTGASLEPRYFQFRTSEPAKTKPVMIRLKEIHSLVIKFLIKKPVISFIFGDIPHVKISHLLLHCQPIVWITEGVANIATASLSEDIYGVCLKDLPCIVSVLVKLKQVLDRLPKFSMYKRSPKSEQLETKMKCALMATVKRSLYKICFSYGAHINELELPSEVSTQLKAFINCKEA